MDLEGDSTNIANIDTTAGNTCRSSASDRLPDKFSFIPRIISFLGFGITKITCTRSWSRSCCRKMWPFKQLSMQWRLISSASIKSRTSKLSARSSSRLMPQIRKFTSSAGQSMHRSCISIDISPWSMERGHRGARSRSIYQTRKSP